MSRLSSSFVDIQWPKYLALLVYSILLLFSINVGKLLTSKKRRLAAKGEKIKETDFLTFKDILISAILDEQIFNSNWWALWVGEIITKSSAYNNTLQGIQ